MKSNQSKKNTEFWMKRFFSFNRKRARHANMLHALQCSKFSNIRGKFGEFNRLKWKYGPG